MAQDKNTAFNIYPSDHTNALDSGRIKTKTQTYRALSAQKMSGLNFRQLPVANGTAFSKIFKNEDNLARYTQIFEKFTRKFSFQLTSLSEFLKFLVEWFAFRKLNSFRNFWKLFREILFHLPLFLN